MFSSLKGWERRVSALQAERTTYVSCTQSVALG